MERFVNKIQEYNFTVFFGDGERLEEQKKLSIYFCMYCALWVIGVGAGGWIGSSFLNSLVRPNHNIFNQILNNIEGASDPVSPPNYGSAKIVWHDLENSLNS